MHARIVSVLRLHLLGAIKSAPPEKTLSTGTLVALLIITNYFISYYCHVFIKYNRNKLYLPVIA
jgi:hypothetical protein